MKFMYLAALMTLHMSSALAQTACPQGVPPGDPRCGPSPTWHQGQQAPAQPMAPRVIVRDRFQVWEDRFGAIASDEEGPFGISEAQKSKEDAERVATEDCVARGGDRMRCTRIAYSYANSCVVYAWGGGVGSFQSGPDQKENEQLVLARCRRISGGVCEIVYAGCSNSVDVGFCPKGVRPPHPSCGPPRQ